MAANMNDGHYFVAIWCNVVFFSKRAEIWPFWQNKSQNQNFTSWKELLKNSVNFFSQNVDFITIFASQIHEVLGYLDEPRISTFNDRNMK